MSPKTASASRKNTRPLALQEWEIPCLNCGRFGTIPGQMITDPFNNTFCSPDCGWSHLLRPIESSRHHAKVAAAAAVAAHHNAAASRPRRHSKRSSRSSRQATTSTTQEQPTQQRYSQRKNSKSQPSETSNASSGRRPPRMPSKANKRLEAWEHAASNCPYSGNAMFDYAMAGGLELE